MNFWKQLKNQSTSISKIKTDILRKGKSAMKSLIYEGLLAQKSVEFTKLKRKIVKSPAYYSRLLEVENINQHARDASNSAYRRDHWLMNQIVPESVKEPLTQEQIQETIDFWKPYEFAYNNDYHQQEVFSALSGRFDPSYFGFGLQRYLMVRFWNHESFRWIREKNYAPLFFPDVKMPNTYMYNSAGIYFDEKRNPVSKDQAIDMLMLQIENGNEVIIKPSDGGEGKDIHFLTPNESRENVEHLIESYGQDFICQEVLKTHPCLSALYSGSVNTMRMCTLKWNDTIYYVGGVLRVGTNKRVDNWSQGGLAVGISEDGTLKKYAITEKGEMFDTHPTTGFKFEGHRIYRYSDAIELVKKLHGHIAQQKYISWDVTVDDKGDLVLIELNSPGSHELVQFGGYSGYVNKEIAKEIFDEYLIRRFFLRRANFDWNYREFSDHISLVEYCGLDTEIAVPQNIEGKPVRLLYDTAIKQNNIRKVFIPSSVYWDRKLFQSINSTCKIVVI